MKNDLEEMQRLLEKATDAGSAPPDELDPESACLREAWLAFGQMLETAPPPILASPLPSKEEPTTSPLALREGPGVRAAPSHVQRHWRLPAAALLAASLLIAVAAAWMLHNANWQADSTAAREQMASTHRKTAPSTQAHTQKVSSSDEPQWDDSLDEQFAQVGWQMLCVQQNQFFRTDAFGVFQYQLQQLSQAIQADAL
jgi:hypothetical protein